MAQSDHRMVVLYKKGALTQQGVKDMRKAGFTVVQVAGEFEDVRFQLSSGFGLAEQDGDAVQVMVLKAALDSFGFSDKLGKLLSDVLRARLRSAENKPAGHADKSTGDA